MRKLSLLAALAAAAIAVPLSIGSSHREAPNISLDPAADNTDTYAFTAKNAPGALTVAANWVPGQVAANGPNFFRFDDRAAYYINIDNTGDGRPEIRYRYTFRTKVNGRGYQHSVPQVTSLNDPELKQREFYSVVRETYRRGRLRSSKRIGRRLQAAPSNVGSKTMPDYSNLANQAIRTLPGGVKVFVGQRDEAFFIDLGATFDSINVRVPPGNAGGGKDDFSGQNTNSIVMQIPERLVTKNRRAVASPDSRNAVVGVWASTERRRVEVTSANFYRGRAPSTERRRGRRGRRAPASVQVSRLANPLVNELFSTVARKDLYNRRTPAGDRRLLGRFVLNPELARFINEQFPGVNAPENNRTDLVQALLEGLPGLNQHKRKGPPPAVDTLKLNLGTPPASGAENRFGVIGGDMAGFPNGRRLADDIVDIEVQLVAGFLKGNKVPLGDGVDQNDKPFLSTFPYLAPPTGGFESNPSDRFEPAHAPTPAGGGPVQQAPGSPGQPAPGEEGPLPLPLP
jgi:hypothetical protein